VAAEVLIADARIRIRCAVRATSRRRKQEQQADAAGMRCFCSRQAAHINDVSPGASGRRGWEMLNS
jgi:hypothetical protein